MEDKEVIETVEPNYDGTLNEEQNDEIEDGIDTEDANSEEEDDDYFDVVEENDNEEPVEDYEDKEYGDEEDDEEGDNDTSESNETSANDAPKNKNEEKLREAVKNLLDSLGIKNEEDPIAELEKLTAETLGISAEEYQRRLASNASFEEQMQRDIKAIHEAFPVTKKYKSLKELPNKEKFAQLMDSKDAKLTAVEAFAASHPDIVKAHNRSPGKKSDLNGTKDHIKSNVPKGAKDTSTYIPKNEMSEYREMFPNLSDSEIKKLYKTANN